MLGNSGDLETWVLGHVVHLGTWNLSPESFLIPCWCLSTSSLINIYSPSLLQVPYIFLFLDFFFHVIPWCSLHWLLLFKNPSIELKLNNPMSQEILGTGQILCQGLQFWSKAIINEKCYQMMISYELIHQICWPELKFLSTSEICLWSMRKCAIGKERNGKKVKRGRIRTD